ncbi:hypothetical protein HDK90DRAFT_172722 [Phyllosticta capitalensis]|uniref:Uncharacterized protein n=1 Tax=Phyllosticta capitalensis TaxID=121624 RepID=A0ABR1YVN5_9PEZI
MTNGHRYRRCGNVLASLASCMYCLPTAHGRGSAEVEWIMPRVDGKGGRWFLPPTPSAVATLLPLLRMIRLEAHFAVEWDRWSNDAWQFSSLPTLALLCSAAPARHCLARRWIHVRRRFAGCGKEASSCVRELVSRCSSASHYHAWQRSEFNAVCGPFDDAVTEGIGGRWCLVRSERQLAGEAPGVCVVSSPNNEKLARLRGFPGETRAVPMEREGGGSRQ